MGSYPANAGDTWQCRGGARLWRTALSVLLILLLAGTASAAAPAAAFSGTPVSGGVPLTVTFTDASAGSPAGWAWFFGDETYSQAWTEQTAGAGWPGRHLHTSVVLPDGSIVLMGGIYGGFMNEVWR